MMLQHYLSFRVGRQWYGVHIDHMIETLHMVALSELPDADPDIIGLITLRNVIMPVVDLRIRFGVQETDITLSTPIVAVRTPFGPVALIVDEVDNVVSIAPDIVEDFDHRESRYVQGIVQLEQHLLMLLDITMLRAERSAEAPSTNGHVRPLLDQI